VKDLETEGNKNKNKNEQNEQRKNREKNRGISSSRWEKSDFFTPQCGPRGEP